MNVSTRINNSKSLEQLRELYGNNSAGVCRAAEIWPHLRNYVKFSLKNKLSENELKLLIDVSNPGEAKVDYMSNVTMFVAEIEDAERFKKVGTKWNVDIMILIDKIVVLNEAQICILNDELYRFWNVPGAFENNKNEKVVNFVNSFN